LEVIVNDETTGITPANGTSDEAPHIESAAPAVADSVTPRGKRRSTWFAVAAGVAAGALVIGGSAYALGASSTKTHAAAKAAFVLGNAAPAANSTALGGSMATRDSKMSAGLMPYWGGGHTVFTAASGLSDAAGSATAYAFDASGINQESLANALAKYFGISDTASLTTGQWIAGAQDGTSANISVNLDGQTSVYFYDPANDAFNCVTKSIDIPPVAPPVATPDSSGNSGSGGSATPGSVGTAPNPGPSCASQNTAPLGTTAEAIASAKDIVKTMGLDPADFQWDATSPTDQGQPVIYVTGSQVVDGQLTGLSQNFTFSGGNKVSNFYGFAAPTVSLGSYGIISEKDAVARLMDPSFGPGGSGGPVAYAMRGAASDVATPMMKSELAPMSSTAGGSVTASSAPAPAPTVPTTPKAGGSFSWPVQQVTIVKADLGVAQYYEPDGSIVLLPTYQLTGNDKSTWTVIALDKSSLDTTVPAP
jgi:hypothetical protein